MPGPIFSAFLKFHQKLRAPYLGEAYSIRVRIRFFLVSVYSMALLVVATAPFYYHETHDGKFDLLGAAPTLVAFATAVVVTTFVRLGRRETALWIFTGASSAFFFLTALHDGVTAFRSQPLDVLALGSLAQLTLAAMMSERRRFLVSIGILAVVSALGIEALFPGQSPLAVWVRFAAFVGFATFVLSFIQSVSRRAIETAETAQSRLLTMNRSLDEQVRSRTEHLEATLEQLRSAQDVLYRREKLASLGEFVSSIVHEVNNPLSAIFSASEYLGQNAQNLPEGSVRLLPQLSPQDIEIVFELLAHCPSAIALEPSARMMERKKYLKEVLQSWELSVDDYLPLFLEAGVTHLSPRWKTLFERPIGKSVLQLLSNYLAVIRATGLIQEAAEKASSFVTALKRFIHKEVRQESKSPFNLAQSVENVLLLFQAQFKSGIRLVWNKIDLEPVFGYPDEMMQIWFNLFNNAIQAMNGKGTLTVELERSQDDAIVSVTDDGPGIPEEYQKRIFEPFFTTKPAGIGTGLGLGIVNDIVKKHGGSMSFVSRPGKTTFIVRIPTRIEPVFS